MRTSLKRLFLAFTMAVSFVGHASAQPGRLKTFIPNYTEGALQIESNVILAKLKRPPKIAPKAKQKGSKIRSKLTLSSIRHNRISKRNNIGRSSSLKLSQVRQLSLPKPAGIKLSARTSKLGGRAGNVTYWNSLRLNLANVTKKPKERPPHELNRPSRTIKTAKSHELVRVLSLNAGTDKGGKAKNSLSNWAITKAQFKRLERNYKKAGRHQYRTFGDYLKAKLALPGRAPSHFILVNVPAGSKLSMSYAAPQLGWGTGGMTQVMLQKKPTLDQVTKPVHLPN